MYYIYYVICNYAIKFHNRGRKGCTSNGGIRYLINPLLYPFRVFRVSYFVKGLEELATSKAGLCEEKETKGFLRLMLPTCNAGKLIMDKICSKKTVISVQFLLCLYVHNPAQYSSEKRVNSETVVVNKMFPTSCISVHYNL